MIQDAKHAHGGPFRDGTAIQMVYMLLENDLPEEDDLVIDGIKRDGNLVNPAALCTMVHQAAKKLGVKVATRTRNGKLLVWRVQE